jgi:hypothetical protein
LVRLAVVARRARVVVAGADARFFAVVVVRFDAVVDFLTAALEFTGRPKLATAVNNTSRRTVRNSRGRITGNPLENSLLQDLSAL